MTTVATAGSRTRLAATFWSMGEVYEGRDTNLQRGKRATRGFDTASYGKRRLEIQGVAKEKLKRAELARLSMLHCANCADAASPRSSVEVSSPMDCPNCGVRYQSGVYVLSNSSMPGLVKIGFTTKGLRERVDQLSAATAVPVPFEVEAWFPCAPHQAKRHEKRIHIELDPRRFPSREFFVIDVSEATLAAERVVGRAPEYRRRLAPR
jgi:hypothetical protein